MQLILSVTSASRGDYDSSAAAAASRCIWRQLLRNDSAAAAPKTASADAVVAAAAAAANQFSTLHSVANWEHFSQLTSYFCGLRSPLVVVAEGHNI